MWRGERESRRNFFSPLAAARFLLHPRFRQRRRHHHHCWEGKRTQLPGWERRRRRRRVGLSPKVRPEERGEGEGCLGLKGRRKRRRSREEWGRGKKKENGGIKRWRKRKDPEPSSVRRFAFAVAVGGGGGGFSSTKTQLSMAGGSVGRLRTEDGRAGSRASEDVEQGRERGEHQRSHLLRLRGKSVFSSFKGYIYNRPTTAASPPFSPCPIHRVLRMCAPLTSVRRRRCHKPAGLSPSVRCCCCRRGIRPRGGRGKKEKVKPSSRGPSLPPPLPRKKARKRREREKAGLYTL